MSKSQQPWTARFTVRSRAFSRLAGTAFLVLLAVAAVAQFRTAREADTMGTSPTWKLDPQFPNDQFTFVRIKYGVSGKYGYGHNGSFRWTTDLPDSDLNFSFRLHQVTSLKVNPDGLILELTDKELFDYPFIYLIEPGRLTFTPEEIPVLRQYLLNGGFLMLDDFWGEREWQNFLQELKLVFPDRPPVDLPLDHPIFHCIFDLKERPQVPNVTTGISSQTTGITWERSDAREVHYRAVLDDKDRIMILICHNTDLGDGWEREGENEYYFREFSEKRAYPLGINIIFYAMTH